MSLSIENFSLSIHESRRVLFDNFNLSIASGEIAVLMGPSGSGKSSLLQFILGVTPEESFSFKGTVKLGEQCLDKLPTERRGVGVLFQDPLLFPHMTVAENLSFALSAKVRGHGARRKVIAEALREAKLDPEVLNNRLPHTLSGGEQARVSLLRTLLSHPQVILLDEPFSKLDAPLRKAFRIFVYESILKRKIPMVLVTHDERDMEDIPKGAVTQKILLETFPE